VTPPTRIAAFKRGFGYAAEYRVYLRESFVGRVAPVSRD